MYAEVSIHKPSNALEMSKILILKDLHWHIPKRCFLGTQGKAHRHSYSPITIILLANWDWTAMRIFISLWSDGWEETESKHLAGKLILEQALVTQWSRLGSQDTDNFCGCPGFPLSQILAAGKSLFSNL